MAAYNFTNYNMLFERIEGLVTGEPRDVVVRHELIVRSSVSVPRERYKDS